MRRSKVSRPGKQVLVLAAAVVVTAAAAAPVMAAATPTRATLTGEQVVGTRGGQYKIQNNEWGASAAASVATDRGTDFTVTHPFRSDRTDGAPAGYPSIYQGCHWGNCSGGALVAHPAREGAGVTSSWSTTQPGGGNVYNAVYDNWFNSTPTTSDRPDCAELMVWLNHHGHAQPSGSRAGTATVDGTHYDVWYDKGAWTNISYEMTRPVRSVRNLNIGDLARDAVHRGYLSASCYLIAVEAGFEVWRGGRGLATNSFSVHVHRSR